MSVGSNLLELQSVDIELARNRALLAEMPELKALAQKRKTYGKLKEEALKLVGARKDLETEVAELDEDEAACHEAVADAQRGGVDPSDYQAVQELELTLTDLAKQLDRIDHLRAERLEALEEARAKEQKAQAYIEQYERAVRAEALETRTKAEAIQADIAAAEKRRAALSQRIPEDVLSTYEQALKQFGGLAVERLDGTVPSICRMALSESSHADLAREEGITRCPYCHRMLILSEED